MYPNVRSPTATATSPGGSYQIHDESTLRMRVNGVKCWLYWLVAGVTFILGGIVCVVFIILEGTNLYDAASRCTTFGIIAVLYGLGTQYMLLEADEEKLEVKYGPCRAYQTCLCCAGCCCQKRLARGELKFEHIREVSVVSGDCRDGFGISHRKYDRSCVHTVICCPSHVVEVRQEGGPLGCCGKGHKIRYAVATQEQAVELQTFLTAKAPAAQPTAPTHGSVNTVGATSPPTYNSVAVSSACTVPAYTLPPSTSFE